MVNHKKLFRVATLLFFIYLLSACSEFETLKSDVSAYYSFEADSIHESLANPNIPIDLLFIRESSITSKSTIFPQQGVTWNESEFLMVANAIHMHEWGEPLTEWIMFDQEHRFECSQTNLGAHYVSYSFFRGV